MDDRKTVLVVDDDEVMRRCIRDVLDGELSILEAADGHQALRSFFQHRPSLVLLDAVMPEMDGWETLRRIRDLADTPVIMLTGLDSENNILRGLKAGADDYITKPFRPAVLAARVALALRKASMAPALETSPTRLHNGELVIDHMTGGVWVRGEEVHLSPIEYRLLRYLADHAGQVLSPSQILEHVWGVDYSGESDYVKNYIRLLRGKIEEDPQHPRYLIVRRGLGYMLTRTSSPAEMPGRT